MDYKQLAVINERKLKEQNERLKILLNNICAYLCELCSHDEDFFTAEHSKMFFDMNKNEHIKYILGE